jgi:hypothetical protein
LEEGGGKSIPPWRASILTKKENRKIGKRRLEWKVASPGHIEISNMSLHLFSIAIGREWGKYRLIFDHYAGQKEKTQNDLIGFSAQSL